MATKKTQDPVMEEVQAVEEVVKPTLSLQERINQEYAVTEIVLKTRRFGDVKFKIRPVTVNETLIHQKALLSQASKMQGKTEDVDTDADVFVNSYKYALTIATIGTEFYDEAVDQWVGFALPGQDGVNIEHLCDVPQVLQLGGLASNNFQH